MARRPDDDLDDDAPWLAEGVPEPRAATMVQRGRLFGGILLFVALGILVGLGIYVISSRKSDGSGGYAKPEDAPLIAADAGPYKERPKSPGGLAVAGAGETMYPAAGGIDPGSSIDTGALAEEPLPRPNAPSAAVAPDAAPAVAPVARKPVDLLPPAAVAAPPPAPPSLRIEPKAVPPKPKDIAAESPSVRIEPKAVPPRPKDVAAPPAGGAALQLGAFSTRAAADAAWQAATARFAYLAGLDKRVDPVSRDGATLYRLRAGGVASKAAAADLCARLKIAGEACIVAE